MGFARTGGYGMRLQRSGISRGVQGVTSGLWKRLVAHDLLDYDIENTLISSACVALEGFKTKETIMRRQHRMAKALLGAVV